MLSAWQQWCRLCGKTDFDESWVDVATLENLSATIEKHFGISFTRSEYVHTNPVCAECHAFANRFQQFAEQCDRANSMYHKLIGSSWSQQNDSNYLQMVRYEAGLDEEKKINIEADDDEHAADNIPQIAKVESSEHAQANGDLDHSMAVRSSARVKTKKEPFHQSDPLETDIDSPSDNETMDVGNELAEQQSSDGVDSMSSASEEIDVNERIPVRRRSKKKAKKKNSREPLPLLLRCLLCNIDFDDKRTFDLHMRKEHTKEERPFRCSQCPKGYTSLYAVTRHETIHLPEELRDIHPCELCGKKFRTIEQVNSHHRYNHSNTNVRAICEECGKDLVNEYSLKEHLLTHRNEFPLQCPHCPKRFKHAASLNLHIDTHGSNTYKCTVCGRELGTKVTLRRHMIVHSEQKKHKCQYCGNEYKRSKSLKTHLIIHTGMRPFTCLWCDKTFAHNANCRSHTKKAHPVELAALEASGKRLPTVQIPKLSDLQPN